MAKNKRKLPDMEPVGKTVSYEKTERKGILRKIGALVTKTATTVLGTIGGLKVGAAVGALAGIGAALSEAVPIAAGVAYVSGGPVIAAAAIGAAIFAVIGGVVGSKVGSALNRTVFPKEKKITHIDYMRKDDAQVSRNIDYLSQQSLEKTVLDQYHSEEPSKRSDSEQVDEFHIVDRQAA